MSNIEKPLQRRFLVSVLVLPLVLVLGSATLLIGDIKERVRYTYAELEGVAYAEKLQRVLVDLQQLRGLFEILRQGDIGVEPEFDVVHQRLERNLAAAESAPEVKEFGLSPAVQDLVDSLRRYLAARDTDSGEDAYRVFTGYVEQVRDLILETANRSHLTLDSELDSYYLMDLLINRLPSLVDAIGRLRGIGAGMIAGDGVDMQGAHLLERRIEATQMETAHVQRDLRILYERDQRWDVLFKPKMDTITEALDRFVRMTFVLAQDGEQDFDALEFFDQGTVTVQICRLLCMEVRSALRGLLHARIDRLERRVILSSVGLAGAILIAALLVVFFYRREHRLVAQVLEERELNVSLVDNLPGLFYLLDERGRFVRWNHEFERVSGYSGSEVAGLLPEQLVLEAQRDLVKERMKEALRDGKTSLEADLVTKSGKNIPIYTTGFQLKLDDCPHIVGFALDISERKALETKLEKMAVTDALTGAFNRARFDDDLENALQQVSRYGRRLSVIALDIDRFKQINDRLGHGTGDLVLKQVVDVMQRQIRKTDTLYRCGGEEFIVILLETALAGAAEQSERLRRAIAGHDFGEVGRVTVSLGVAEYRDPEQLHELLKRADDALYIAKNEGRDRTEIAA